MGAEDGLDVGLEFLGEIIRYLILYYSRAGENSGEYLERTLDSEKTRKQMLNDY